MKITLAILASTIVCAASVGPSRLQEPVTVSYGDVAWSPDSTYLSFTEYKNTGAKMSPASLKMDIYVVRPDGSGLRRVTTDHRNNGGAVWAKDGKRLFFAASLPGQMGDRTLYSMALDGTDIKALGFGSAPDVSPDGTRLVFNCETTPRQPQICVMDVDGSHRRALTQEDSHKFYAPTWSPDGKSIAYYLEKGDRKDQIWTMRADGSDASLLTNNIGHNYYPTWLADGRRLMFSSDRDGTRALYTMNADGSDIRRFLEHVSSGRFSPDGRKLALIAGGRTDSRIVIADADGVNQRTILPK